MCSEDELGGSGSPARSSELRSLDHMRTNLGPKDQAWTTREPTLAQKIRPETPRHPEARTPLALGAHPRPPKGQGYPRGPVTSASRGEEGRGTLEEPGRGAWESSPVTKTKAPKVEIHTFCPTFSALTCEPALALGQCHRAPSQDVLTFSTRTRTSLPLCQESRDERHCSD